MKKYYSIFRIKFLNGIQYRTAAVAGCATQFFWGVMEILLYRAFYDTNPTAFPMEFSAMVSYIWLQQAFLALFATWVTDNEIFNLIADGNVSYELCRPFDLYTMWFTRNIANRVAKAVLRCFPILLVAVLLPAPYGISFPKSTTAFLLFLLSAVLAVFVIVAFFMLIYITTFYTISPLGVRVVSMSVIEFLSGAVIPLPFFPDWLQKNCTIFTICIHAECSITHLQWRHCWTGCIFQYFPANSLGCFSGSDRQVIYAAGIKASSNSRGIILSPGFPTS